MSDNDLVEVAKNFLNSSDRYKHLSDGEINVEHHEPALDSKFIPQLDGVDESHLNDNTEHIVSFTKQIEVAPNVIIPKIVRVTIKNGQVDKTVESK